VLTNHFVSPGIWYGTLGSLDRSTTTALVSCAHR
jgi:hypothetical protein